MTKRRLTRLRSECNHGNVCPTVHYDAAGDRFAMQGDPVTEPDVLAELNLPPGEAAVWMPARLLPELRRETPPC